MNPDPIATYRLQLHPGFGFIAAAELLPYLAELGISHVYTSPYLQAAAGSTHGYDVVDPTRINTELGGDAGHEQFCRAMKQTGLAHMLDLVPNHMAILADQNPWWWDVLENGPSSFYAPFFDVDWESSEDRWPNKVLLPVLGDHYGRVLEAGELKLDRKDHVFMMCYYEHVFPVDLSSLGNLLTAAATSQDSDMLHFIADCCNRLPRPTITSRQGIVRRQRDKAVIHELLNSHCREEKLQEAISAEIERTNQDLEALDRLLDQQNYRLAFWRTAGRDLGYRRFFDINELAGLRVENEEVFMATHALPLKWLQEGTVQGLRVDHPDGLRDPAGYFMRLRQYCPDAWIVAEKILEPGEELPRDWPIQGTTGYDFLNLASGLFIDPRGKQPLTRLYTEFINEDADFRSLVKSCKHQIITESLGSELNRLTALFVEICEGHRRHRDYTRDQLREVLLLAATAFPVYRSYVRAAQERRHDGDTSPAVSAADRSYVRQALADIETQYPGLDHELLNFLEKILVLEIPGKLEGELAMRFQQFTSPAMAKGVEDTAFYRYHRLVCLNEVGGDPDLFGISPDEFHKHGARIQEKYPRTLLAGTTHDTKRGEDVRARLALLSEIPRQWAGKTKKWFKKNGPLRTRGLPEANTEYLIYQTLVGAWPIDAERLGNYLEKAMREAKLYTSWTRQDHDYEEAVLTFSRALLEDRDFCEEMDSFLAPLIPAGRINGLAQTLLRLTFPGVPDIYQGSELWEMSLVDPDNRRPVDFARHRRLLAELPDLKTEQVMARMEEGLPKMWLIRQTMRFRRARPDLFGAESSYEPMHAQGAKAKHVVSFCRGQSVITVVPRLLLKLKDNWQNTSLKLPPGAWNNMLTGEHFSAGPVSMAILLANFPVALLAKENSSQTTL